MPGKRISQHITRLLQRNLQFVKKYCAENLCSSKGCFASQAEYSVAASDRRGRKIANAQGMSSSCLAVTIVLI